MSKARLMDMNTTRYILLWVVVGTLAAGIPVPVGAVLQPGDCAQDVRNVLGWPEQFIQINEREIWYYERGRVDLEDGRVVTLDLVSEEEAAARRERIAHKRSQREEAEQVRREFRVAEAFDRQAAVLSDPSFLRLSPAERLAYWRNFKRGYPDIPLPDDYYDSLRILEAERHQQAAERRLVELERQIEDAEHNLRRAEAKERAYSRDPGSNGSVSYPVYYTSHRQFGVTSCSRGPGHYAGQATRMFSDHRHKSNDQTTSVHAFPHAGTLGYAFQKSYEELCHTTTPVAYTGAGVGARSAATVGTSFRPNTRPVTRIGY